MKKFVVRDLKLREISSVDRPAQQGALVVLMKSQSGDDVAIRKNADEVVKGDAKPGYTVAQYEDAMFRRADELSLRHNITPQQALAKGLNSASDIADTELRDLAHAAEVARVAEYGRRRGTVAA